MTGRRRGLGDSDPSRGGDEPSSDPDFGEPDDSGCCSSDEACRGERDEGEPFGERFGEERAERAVRFGAVEDSDVGEDGPPPRFGEAIGGRLFVWLRILGGNVIQIFFSFLFPS